MKIINILFTTLTLLLTMQLYAQSIERATFDIAGGVATTDQYEVHYSLGQLFTKTIDLGDIIVSEGFIQGSIEEVTTPVILFPEMEVRASPNPSFDFIRIRTSASLPNSTIMLFDVTGKMIINKSFEQDMEIQVKQFPTGTYLLNWVDANRQLVRQFKVVKL